VRCSQFSRSRAARAAEDTVVEASGGAVGASGSPGSTPDPGGCIQGRGGYEVGGGGGGVVVARVHPSTTKTSMTAFSTKQTARRTCVPQSTHTYAYIKVPDNNNNNNNTHTQYTTHTYHTHTHPAVHEPRKLRKRDPTFQMRGSNAQRTITPPTLSHPVQRAPHLGCIRKGILETLHIVIHGVVLGPQVLNLFTLLNDEKGVQGEVNGGEGEVQGGEGEVQGGEGEVQGGEGEVKWGEGEIQGVRARLWGLRRCEHACAGRGRTTGAQPIMLRAP
jgi:hypothetical protein